MKKLKPKSFLPLLEKLALLNVISFNSATLFIELKDKTNLYVQEYGDEIAEPITPYISYFERKNLLYKLIEIPENDFLAQAVKVIIENDPEEKQELYQGAINRFLLQISDITRFFDEHEIKKVPLEFNLNSSIVFIYKLVLQRLILCEIDPEKSLKRGILESLTIDNIFKVIKEQVGEDEDNFEFKNLVSQWILRVVKLLAAKKIIPLGNNFFELNDLKIGYRYKRWAFNSKALALQVNFNLFQNDLFFDNNAYYSMYYKKICNLLELKGSYDLIELEKKMKFLYKFELKEFFKVFKEDFECKKFGTFLIFSIKDKTS